MVIKTLLAILTVLLIVLYSNSVVIAQNNTGYGYQIGPVQIYPYYDADNNNLNSYPYYNNDEESARYNYIYEEPYDENTAPDYYYYVSPEDDYNDYYYNQGYYPDSERYNYIQGNGRYNDLENDAIQFGVDTIQDIFGW